MKRDILNNCKLKRNHCYNSQLIIVLEFVVIYFLSNTCVSQPPYQKYWYVGCSNRTHYRSFGRLRVLLNKYITTNSFENYFRSREL